MKRREFLQSSSAVALFALSSRRAAYAAVRSGATPDVAAVTGDGRPITLRGADIEDLAAQLRGPLLLAGDDGYEEARLILNPSFDKRPALIAQVTGVADTQAAVQFAQAHQLLLAVKCGGHSHSGQSTCNGGMMIDLKDLRGVRVDPRARRAWVDGGTLLGHVDHESTACGLVTPLGTVSHTGVGGLTLGGGFGRLSRRYGMAIDNLESVDLVTADAQLRRASAADHRDLFWALRGGGGNFGVAVTFEFRLHPMRRQVIAGKLTFPIEKARDVLRMFADYAPEAPDELYMDPVLLRPPGGAPGLATVEVCYSGEHADAERALAPLRKLGTPLQDTIQAVNYELVQRMNDATDARAVATYLKGGFISELSDKLISAIVDGLEGHPDRATLLFFQHCGGAAGRVAESATAFAHRYALANMMTVVGWPHGAEPQEHIEAARRHWRALQPFTRGFYINDMAREASVQDVNENYRGNYQRLVAIKTKYDPGNLFRLNANVQPAGRPLRQEARGRLTPFG